MSRHLEIVKLIFKHIPRRNKVPWRKWLLLTRSTWSWEIFQFYLHTITIEEHQREPDNAERCLTELILGNHLEYARGREMAKFGHFYYVKVFLMTFDLGVIYLESNTFIIRNAI